MTTTPAIEVAELVRSYGDYEAVKGVSFQVNRGEVFGLLGTNGAGKTSTLEVIEGLSRPTSGTVRISGLDPVADRAILRPELGIMLQSGGLPSQLTVLETMNMWHGTCSYPRDIKDVLASVDLLHRENVKVGALSGGEQRRLDLACALLGDPSILFLDEPTTGLDPESRRHTWQLLQELKQRGVTMMLTTHYLEEAEFLCDRIAIMDSGEIAVAGTLEELAAREKSIISFVLSGSQVDLPRLGGAEIIRELISDNAHIRISTSHLQEHTLELLSWASASGIVLENFAAKPATLESVFMEIASPQTAPAR
ncbi:ABC transporter ATP-binding protein [Corynebacterium suranareeae]|uniref:ABC transporter ATP-binding protein n=1 Tax=Corynebacterium suranareeae TaxID=2506452 RepID=A0A160PNC3_9CORY|nr:ABC transporter ATP-binding protein [Corynebacterium suranareeae]BAU95329.1 ABC transporter ATP-binding protein [Corynebacterium suranareeae]